MSEKVLLRESRFVVGTNLTSVLGKIELQEKFITAYMYVAVI